MDVCAMFEAKNKTKKLITVIYFSSEAMRLTTDVEVATNATFQDSTLINGDDEAQLGLESQDEGNSKQGSQILYLAVTIDKPAKQ